MPKTLLLSTSTISGRRLETAVANSFIFIWKLPSLVTSTVFLTGADARADRAAPMPKPIVPNPPEGDERTRFLKRIKLRRPHLVLAHIGRHRRILRHALGGCLEHPYRG